MMATKGVIDPESSDYSDILKQAVAVIEQTRITIAKSVNNCVSAAYWHIGKLLHERKVEGSYGDGVVKRLSADLKDRYPKMGVSTRNLWDMKKFYERFSSSEEKLRQAVAVLPWGHVLRLMQKVGEDDNARLTYPADVYSVSNSRELLTAN